MNWSFLGIIDRLFGRIKDGSRASLGTTIMVVGLTISSLPVIAHSFAVVYRSIYNPQNKAPTASMKKKPGKKKGKTSPLPDMSVTWPLVALCGILVGVGAVLHIIRKKEDLKRVLQLGEMAVKLKSGDLGVSSDTTKMIEDTLTESLSKISEKPSVEVGDI